MRKWVLGGSLAALVVGCSVQPGANGENGEEQDQGQQQQAATGGTSVSCARAPVVTLTASPSELKLGQTTTISWQFEGGDGCVPTRVQLLFRDAASGAVQVIGSSGSTGSIVKAPQSTGEYFLQTVENGYEVPYGEAFVNVTLPKQPDGSTVINITQSGRVQAGLFAQAVGIPNARVWIAGNVELDMTTASGIHVAPGVQIIGDRLSNPRGPRVYTTSFPDHLLDIGSLSTPSDGVRITGLRLEGGESSDPCDSAGTDDSDAIDIYSSWNVEIANNEMSRWRGTAVNVHDKYQNRLDITHPVWVHDNFMHDNQHPTYCGLNPKGEGHGGGYGVSVAEGGFARIENNVFDRNRHSVAGHGSDGDGYQVFSNLFFNPGVDDVKVGFTNYNHQIDMHGQESCNGWFDWEHYNCGRAGDYMDIAYNTVVSTGAGAIQLRGIPQTGMAVHDNVFSQSKDDALTQTVSGQIQDTGGNLYSKAIDLVLAFPAGRGDPGSGQCDFDRDGVNDAFRATGRTWWYFSSLTQRWVFLRNSRDQPTSYADSNGDGRCDAWVGGTAFATGHDAPFDVGLPAARNWKVGEQVSVQLSATGGGALQWAATNLPAGVSIHPTTGLISGTVSAVASQRIQFSARDQRGAVVYGSFPWTVSPNLSPVPYVVGASFAVAAGQLGSAGFGYPSSHEVLDLDCSAPDGTVIGQTPAAGTLEPPGFIVTLDIEKLPTGNQHCN